VSIRCYRTELIALFNCRNRESDYETEGRDLEQTIHTYTKGERQTEAGSGQTDGMMDTINV